ncbi:hypothetical protein K491DRAFT_714024 [Lophiostoma macrostomum CBS 122681]|uniref:Telomere-associated protein Rif1 N-terminal domain-containing protein n=1 Tax=Lophiostoma macrostomum CBS 122681 TaxID=1314788 RepID=A0A6A6TGZ9_9PLEO|nr:hypothetical protein K491DRAFT_714024 [Lophiostoma macrostomum CBS 122681]
MAFSKFESISVRPPTPPKDVKDTDVDDHDTLQFLQDPFGTQQESTLLASSKASLTSLNTPDSSPSSEPSDPFSNSSRKKRVSFECKTSTIPPHLTAQPWTPQRSSPLRPLPQTRVSRPLKPILKAADPTSTPPLAAEGLAAHKFSSFAEMLESIVKMLAQGGRPSKIDAYHTLQKTMQAYDNKPDIAALINKMGLFEQFIQRDMQAPGINGTGLDTPLQSQAIKLLMAFVRIPELKTVMDDEFCSFVIDRIIAVSADPAMPKAVVNHHLALLMQQNFRPRTMTMTRVERIIHVLDTIHERVTGFSVQAYRIRVYRKLIQQRKDTMAKHSEQWFKHLLKAMLTNQKDIHNSAMDTAVSAARDLSSDRIVNKSVLSIFNRVKSDGDTFGTAFAHELEKLLGQDSAASVPSIWGIITAFLQNSLQENKFTALRDWLKVFEKFLCSENDAVKMQTNIAFGFLIYAVDISESTSTEWSNMFLKISQHQLGQRLQGKRAEIETATSGYLTLLYYALRPTASHIQLDRYWTDLVANFWRPHAYSSARHAVAACRITSALLNGSRKPWNQQRALELRPHLMVQRGELPILDPKWVRKALKSVLQFVETLLEATPWTLEALDDEPAKTLWIALLDSLLEASSKEIMASTETKDAIAHVVNMLRRMWDSHTAKLALPQQKEASWADKYCFLIETVVQKLGAYQFADKCLARNRQEEFEVAPTPSNRSRQHGPRTSPLLYFVELLVSRSEGRLPDLVRLRALQLILEPCLVAQNTRLGKLDLLRDCSAALGSTVRSVVAFNFWNQIGTLTKACLEENPTDTTERQSRQFGKEYDAVVDILTFGSDYLLSIPRGQELLSAFVATVRKETSEGGVVLAVVEKVSKSILNVAGKENSQRCLPYTIILLRSLPKTVTRRMLEQGRQMLHPSSPPPTRTPEFDPYNHFYATINFVGTAAYVDLDVEGMGKTQDFIAALKDSIDASSQSLLAVYLRKIQGTIRIWVEDAQRKLESKVQSVKHLRHEVLTLWRSVNAALEKLPRKDSLTLTTLAPLITAGFVSRRREIVNVSITTWNATFGRQDDLQYPAELEKALRRLSKTVDILLPRLLENDHDDGDLSPFYESDSSSPETPQNVPSTLTVRAKESPFKISKPPLKQTSRSPAIPGSSRRKPPQRTPKIRLRHENSQYQFEPILSSPTNPFEQESQVLTERQKEMIERHRLGTNMFSHMNSSSVSRQGGNSSRQNNEDIPSDGMSIDGLPNDTSPLPLKALAAMTPMDVYLGSSPTPSSRHRKHGILDDEASMLTPDVDRPSKFPQNTNELGSSPPRVEKPVLSISDLASENDTTHKIVGDSFEHRHPQAADAASVDEGTTVDEEMLPVANLQPEAKNPESSDDEQLTELDSADMPSSTMELELNAQLNAEMNADAQPLAEARIEVPAEVPEESNNVYVDASSQRPFDVTADDSEVGETQTAQSQRTAAAHGSVRSESTSRVGNSFSSPIGTRQAASSPVSQSLNLRRSSRHSVVSSPGTFASTRKRKQLVYDVPSPNKKSKEVEIKTEQSPVKPTEKNPVDEEDMFDCIAVASPILKRKRGRPRSLTPADDSLVVPETSRKRSIHRSASLLSQVQSQSDDVLVEDTPAPKRARREASKDVSEAQDTTLSDTQSSHVKRLSHVRVSPKAAPSMRKSSTVPEDQVVGLGEAAIQPVCGSSLGEQNANVALQLRGDTTGAVMTEQTQTESVPAALSTSRSFREILTPKSLLAKLREFASELQHMVLGPGEEREIYDATFELSREAHAAARRGQQEGS